MANPMGMPDLPWRDDPDAVATRLASARGEMAAVKQYDYAVVNDELERAVREIECILTAESLKTSRQEPAHRAFLPV